MKTSVSILVEDESIISKSFTLLWFVNIFKKSKLIVSIDGKNYELTASKTPYVIDVESGAHVIRINDSKAGQKSMMRSMTGAFTGFAFGLAGSGLTALDAAVTGAELMKTNIHDGIVECGLNEGDILKLSCKCTRKGAVKIKQLQ